MLSKPINMALLQYVQEYEKGNIRVNRSYQRSGGLWTRPAKSFLIDSIIHGFPIPKLALRLVDEDDPLKALKYEVIDGQQRTITMAEFISDGFSLSDVISDAEYIGSKFSQLPKEIKTKITTYNLAFDSFIEASDDDVQNLFRRINAYTASITSEEIRNATYQGEFKWWVVSICRQVSNKLVRLKVLSKADILRLRDQRFIADLVFIFDRGFKTSKSADIDSLYERNDLNNPFGALLTDAILESIEYYQFFKDIEVNEVTNKNIFMMLLASRIFTHYEIRIPDYCSLELRFSDRQTVIRAVQSLEEDLATGDQSTALLRNIEGSLRGANVGSAKLHRFDAILAYMTISE